MASCEKDKDFLKGLKEMKSQLKIKRQNAQKECQKKSKSR